MRRACGCEEGQKRRGSSLGFGGGGEERFRAELDSSGALVLPLLLPLLLRLESRRRRCGGGRS